MARCRIDNMARNSRAFCFWPAMARLQMHRHKLPMSAPSLRTHTAQDERLRGDTWMSIRARVLTRDAGICRCAECADRRRSDPGFALPAHEVDHIIPLSAGGSNELVNLQAINVDCHRRKSAQEAAGAARVAV